MGRPSVRGATVSDDPVGLHREPGSTIVRWTHGGVEVVKEHPRPVRSAAYVADPPSIVIVEEPTTPTPEPMRNAVVYDLDGTERLRLVPPAPPVGWWSEGFDQCFPDRHGLVTVCIVRRELKWAYVDLTTGELGPLAPFR